MEQANLHRKRALTRPFIPTHKTLCHIWKQLHPVNMICLPLKLTANRNIFHFCNRRCHGPVFGCREIFSNYSFGASLEAVKEGRGGGTKRKILLIASKKENADRFPLSKENRFTRRRN